MAKIKKKFDESELVIFRKPNQFLTMNTTGLNRFQAESLNVLLHEAQKSNSSNSVYGKTEMNRNKYGVKMEYLLKMTSDNKDCRQFKDIKIFIDALSKFRLSSIDGVHGNIKHITVFPSIKYESEKGVVEFTLEDSIEHCVLNTTFLGESKRSKNPKKYFTAVDIRPIKYDKPLIDKSTGEIIGYKKDSRLSVSAIGVLNFLTRNIHLWFERDENITLELDEEEFRYYANCSSESVFIDDIVTRKYDKPSELKKLISSICEEIKYSFGVTLFININKIGRGISSIDFNVLIDEKAEEFYDNLKNIEEKIKNPKIANQTKENIVKNNSILQNGVGANYEENFNAYDAFGNEIDW